jgi:hypothetical protein
MLFWAVPSWHKVGNGTVKCDLGKKGDPHPTRSSLVGAVACRALCTKLTDLKAHFCCHGQQQSPFWGGNK